MTDARIPDDLREALTLLTPEGAEIALRIYLAASPGEQEEMLAFIRCGGPARCRQLVLKHIDGTPTADDLETWL